MMMRSSPTVKRSQMRPVVASIYSPPLEVAYSATNSGVDSVKLSRS